MSWSLAEWVVIVLAEDEAMIDVGVKYRLFSLSYWLCPLPTFLPVFPLSGSSSSLWHWRRPTGDCMTLYLSTSLMTFIVLPTSPADKNWGQWVHCSWQCWEHALWPSFQCGSISLVEQFVKRCHRVSKCGNFPPTREFIFCL